jgi:CDP-glucose 4,6-dehydratase
MGSLKVYLAAQKTQSVKSLISITTDKVYFNTEKLMAYKESDRLGGYDPYSSSKACAEIMSDSFRQSFLQDSEMKICTTRAGNIVGGGDWAQDRIIPDLVRAQLSNEIAQIRSPQAIRPWQHVLEPVWGYLLLALHMNENTNHSHAFNFGPEPKETHTVLDLCQEMKLQWPELKFNVQEQKSILHEAQTLKLDSSLAQSELGWRPMLSFSETCAWTSDWYKNYSNGTIITEQQIKNFKSKIELG